MVLVLVVLVVGEHLEMCLGLTMGDAGQLCCQASQQMSGGGYEAQAMRVQINDLSCCHIKAAGSK